MNQFLVRVRLPTGLDPSYSFTERELLSYGLNVVPTSVVRKYRNQYQAILPCMLPLKVIVAELDYDRLADAFCLDDVRVLSGNRLVTRFLGVRNGEEFHLELPVADRPNYEVRKSVRSMVYQQNPVLSWGEDERVAEFFQIESGRKLNALQYFPVTAQILTDWNVIFPKDPLPLETPQETSGLFYYYT